METAKHRLEIMTKVALDALKDVKGEDITLLNIRSKNAIFSRLLLASGKSSRQVRALGERVALALKETGFDVLGIEGLDNGEWVLVDGGDLLIHAMQKEIRDFYDLETLWSSEDAQETA